MNEFLNFISNNFILLIFVAAGFALISIDQPLLTMLMGAIVVSPEDAAKMMADKPVIVDARIEKEFFSSHIAGALHVLLDMKKIKSIKSKKDVIVYTNGSEGCASLVRILKKYGYTNVYILKGGLEAWLSESRPVVNSRRSK